MAACRFKDVHLPCLTCLSRRSLEVLAVTTMVVAGDDFRSKGYAVGLGRPRDQ